MDKPVYNITINSPITINIHHNAPLTEERKYDPSKYGLEELGLETDIAKVIDEVIEKTHKTLTNSTFIEDIGEPVSKGVSS